MLVFGAVSALTVVTTLAGILAAGGAAALAKSGICFVQEGELGAKKFCGRAVRYRFNRGRYHFGKKKGQRKYYHFGKKKGEFKTERNKGELKKYEPGATLTIPGILKLAKINIRKTPIRMHAEVFTLADRTVFTCASVIIFRIEEHEPALYQVLFGTSDFHEVISVEALLARMDILAEKDHTCLSGPGYKSLREELESKLQTKVEELGVKILSFGLLGSDPDPLTNLRLQIPELVDVSATATQAAAVKLGLDDRKEALPALAAALLPGNQALVETSVPPTTKEAAEEGNEPSNGNGNGHGKVPDLGNFLKLK